MEKKKKQMERKERERNKNYVRYDYEPLSCGKDPAEG
jgi:hypothetical protein